MRYRKGFSLVELMIVIVIMGVIAAIAFPQWRAMQAKSKRAEMPPNVDAIKVSEVGFHTSREGFVDCERAPRSVPDKTPVEWVTNDGYTELGWLPTGAVRAVYEVEYVDGESDFLVRANTDVDGDGNQAEYTATVSLAATLAAGDEDAF